MDIDSRTMARLPFPVSKDDWHFSLRCRPRCESICLSCSFRLRRGSRKMISRAKRIARYPRPFPRIKSRISKRCRETKRPVVVNFMQILAFREFVSFHHREIPARSRAHNDDTRSSPLPFMKSYVRSLLFIRASFTLKTVRQIALLALYRFDSSFLYTASYCHVSCQTW